MRFLKVFTIFASLLLGACAWNRTTTGTPSDYVEIDNPAATMSPDSPATILVPRSSVEKGIPRGGELLKKGAEQVVQGIRGTSGQAQPVVPEQQPPSAATAQNAPLPANQQPVIVPAYAAPPSMNRQAIAAAAPQPYDGRSAAVGGAASVKNRIALLETGREGVLLSLYENLRRTAICGFLDPDQSKMLAQYATLTNETEKTAFAIRMQQDYGVNIVIYLSAPDGVTSGKEISAEVYDAMGGGMLQKFDGVINQEPVKDQSDRNIASLPASFTDKIRELLALLPWYGRITAVEGNRAYIAAGREAGLRIGQTLKIYQSGRFMKGLGFAPGEQVGTLSVQGFVGPNGSFAMIREGQGTKASDIVSVE